MKQKRVRLFARTVLFLVLVIGSIGGYKTSYASDTFQKIDAGSKNEKSEKLKEMKIPINITSSTITAVEGNTGKINIEKFEGIEFKGTFKKITNNSHIELREDGSWTAKKTGETTISVIFQPSGDTINEIEKKYPETNIYWSDRAQVVKVTINEQKEMEIPINITPTTITTIEGSSGKLSVGKFEGIELKGTFKEITNNPNIELRTDGTWTAKRVGTTELMPLFYPSKETIKEIQKKYPETDLYWSDIAQVVGVKINEQKEMEIPINITTSSITAIEGSTGQLSVEKFEGIELKGTFKEITNNPNIELRTDGTWTAKKDGITKLTPIFSLSVETVNEIKKKYPGVEISWKDIADVVNVTINPSKEIDLTINFTPNSITTQVGETGKLSVGKFVDIEIKGAYREIKDNPYIELTSDGTWIAKKVGTTELVPTFDISEETLKEVSKKYPRAEISWKDIAQVINVTIAAQSKKTLSTTKKNVPTATATVVNNQRSGVKTLPKTGDSKNSNGSIIFGGIVLFSVGSIHYYRKRTV